MTIHVQTLMNRIQSGTHDLLTSMSIETRQSAYTSNDTIRFMATSYPTEVEGYYDIQITISPLLGPATWLSGLPVILQPTRTYADRSETVTRFGRLNHQGQVLFRNMLDGTYQTMVVPTATALHTPETPLEQPAGRLIAFPPQPLRKAAAARSRDDDAAAVELYQRTFQNETGSLTAIVEEQDSGEYTVQIEASHPDWHGSLLAVACSNLLPDTTVSPTPQRFLTILTWNERYQLCEAELNLGRLTYAFAFTLTDQPFAPAMLAQESPETIQRSIACAATYYTRRAWFRLLEHYRFPPDLHTLIEQALNE